MAYSLDSFLKPLKDTDRTVRIFDDRGVSTYAINPFSVLRIYANADNLNIILTGKKSVILDFVDEDQTRLALVKLQTYVDQLKQKVPISINQETEKYVEDAVLSAITGDNVATINGLTASNQNIRVSGDNVINAYVESKTETHSISVGLTGIVPLEHGGTNNISGYIEGQFLSSNGTGLVSSGFSVNDGSSSSDIWSAAQIISVISSITSKEVVMGNVDGVNRHFYIQKIPVKGTEHVFINGLLQMEGYDNDYVIESNMITFEDAPIVGMKIICSYCVDYLSKEVI